MLHRGLVEPDCVNRKRVPLDAVTPQEVVADETLPLNAVVSANEELAKVKKEAEALEAAVQQNSFSDGGDTGVKLTELYDKLHELNSGAAEAQASKFLRGQTIDEDGTGTGRTASRMWRDYSVVLDFTEPTENPPPLLQLIEVSFCYPKRSDFRLSNVDVDPAEGGVRRSQKLRIGRYSQHFVDQLKMEETPV
ncbi:unnamed protein product [Arabidopsis arenosa]|uniref:Uncharacterized protein n=1 Tax=Arabidopsis arenosa TaxID=38785 RepID=A0A8S2ATL5_ARAAE|nr:unnamed protein product [Arabidopsis arenosa]